MQRISIPRSHAASLDGWLLSDPALPHHEIRFFRALLNQRPSEAERATIRAQAEEAEPKRHVSLEILVHRDAA
jgi:hypothetical protein